MDSPAPSRERVIAGAALGGATGVVLALLEALRALPLVTGVDRLALLHHLGAWLPAAGSVLGALFAWGGPALGRLSRRLFPSWPEDRAFATGLALVLLPAFGYVGYQLFAGGQMRLIAVRHLLWPLAAVCFALGFVTVATVARRLLARFEGLTRGGAIAIGVALGLFAVLLHEADLRLYPRLYGYLHACLASSTAATVAFTLALVRRRMARGAPRRGRRFARIAAVVALVVLVGTSFATLGSRQTVRYVVFERTAIGKYVLRGVDRVFTASGGTTRLPRATRRAIYERERRARRAAGRYGDLAGANVLLVTIDALRADHTGFSGGTRLTPHLDAFAKKAVVFDRAYCQAPHSSYSLTSLHTSEYMHEIVLLAEPPQLPTLADILNAKGYFSAAFYTRGVFHTEGERLVHYNESRFGFSVADHGNRRAEVITDRAIEELDRIVDRGEPRFFLWTHYFDTHEPYRDTSLGTSPHDRYRGEVRHVDREVSRLLDHVRRVVARDTIVVITADHGEEFREHGGHYHGSTLYDEQVRVPLVVSFPGVRPRHVRQVVESVDVGPTLLSLLGVQPPPSMRGDDLRPLVFDGDGAMPELPAFSTVIHKKMVVAWPYKLIADLRFDVFELYNLERDPAETVNLYDRQRDVADRLKQEIYAWLDRVRSTGGGSRDSDALALGRLGDRRAIPDLGHIARDRAEPVERRAEAVRLIGRLADARTKEGLVPLLSDREPALAVAVAAALAAMADARGSRVLVESMYSEDPKIRVEAAIALGDLRDRRAVPGLVEGLGAEDLEVRKDAIRKLGLLRDTRGIEPLLQILPEYRTRYLVVLALGMIGDPRSYDTLIELLGYETHTDIRGYAVAGLGWIGDADAIDRLLQVLREEPELRWTSESLIRLGALARGKLYGTDVRRGAPALVSGFGPCHEMEYFSFDEFMNQTWCETVGPKATVHFDVPSSAAATLIVRARHLGGADRVVRTIPTLNGHRLEELTIGDAWTESRVEVPAGVFVRGRNVLELTGVTDEGSPPSLGLDHVLILPRADDA